MVRTGLTVALYFVFCPVDRKAVLLLKKKRYQDQLLDKTDNQISNLEQLVSQWSISQPTSQQVNTVCDPTVGDVCVFSRSKTWSLRRLKRKSSLG